MTPRSGLLGSIDGHFLEVECSLVPRPVAYLLTLHDGGEDGPWRSISALSQAFATPESNLKSNFALNTGVMAPVKTTKINVFTVSFRRGGLRFGPAQNCIRGQTQPGSQTPDQRTRLPLARSQVSGQPS